MCCCNICSFRVFFWCYYQSNRDSWILISRVRFHSVKEWSTVGFDLILLQVRLSCTVDLAVLFSAAAWVHDRWFAIGCIPGQLGQDVATSSRGRTAPVMEIIKILSKHTSSASGKQLMQTWNYAKRIKICCILQHYTNHKLCKVCTVKLHTIFADITGVKQLVGF